MGLNFGKVYNMNKNKILIIFNNTAYPYIPLDLHKFSKFEQKKCK